MRLANRRVLLVLTIVLATALLTTSLVGAQGAPAEAVRPADIRLQPGAEPLDGVEVAVRLSRQANPDPAVIRRVVLASSATFADALSSAVMQDDGPLLLVPPALPLPASLHAELARLAPAEVVLLGGPAAISEGVEGELERLGFATRRISGASRVETATAVAAAEAPQAVTALLVRAFDADGGNSSAAWADSVTAGALSTQLQLPILLTETGRLTEATRAHLQSSTLRTVIIVGGTSAVSAGVEQELRDGGYIVSRVAGRTRYETALAVAAARRLDVTTSRAILLDGAGEHGWQAGLAAARHAWLDGAPILPVAGEAIPPEVQAYMSEVQPPAVTCIVAPGTCTEARQLAGLPALPDVAFTPPAGSAIAAGETLAVGVDDPDRLLRGEVSVSSDCAISSVQYLPEGSASFTLKPPGDEEAGGDHPPVGGAVPVQPLPGSGEATGAQGSIPSSAPLPIDANEPSPNERPLTTCLVTTTLQRADGGDLVDVTAFEVVDLRPRFRATTTPQVEDRPVTFLDRSDGLIDRWLWDFGDGSHVTGDNSLQHPDHTYDAPGCYDVALTVTSPLRHWLTGRAFTDTEVRTLAVDPASQARGVLEVLILDAATDTIAPGEPIAILDGAGDVLDVQLSGDDGWAVFGALVPGAYTVQSVNTPKDRFTQQVLGGQALCPALRLGPTGSLLVVVEDTSTGQPVSGAQVQITDGDGVLVAGGLTGAAGTLLAEDLAVGTYGVAVTAAGLVPGSVGAAVEEDQVVPVPVLLSPPAPPPPPPPPPPSAEGEGEADAAAEQG